MGSQVAIFGAALCGWWGVGVGQNSGGGGGVGGGGGGGGGSGRRKKLPELSQQAVECFVGSNLDRLLEEKVSNLFSPNIL